MSSIHVSFKLGTIPRELTIWPKNWNYFWATEAIHERKGRKTKSIFTAEKVYDILNKTVIKYDWEQKMTLSVPNIKSFFSNTPEKMEEIMEQMDIGGAREEEGNM